MPVVPAENPELVPEVKGPFYEGSQVKRKKMRDGFKTIRLLGFCHRKYCGIFDGKSLPVLWILYYATNHHSCCYRIMQKDKVHIRDNCYNGLFQILIEYV